MSTASFTLQGYNPDVLTCIANLSSDEVFTPPELANQMLDALEESWSTDNGGDNIWTRSDVTFLDPSCKSGVFLREIVKRLSDLAIESIGSSPAELDKYWKSEINLYRGIVAEAGIVLE